MLRKILFSSIVVLSLIGISNIDSYSKNTECPNYYVERYIGTVLYIYEYTCDGTLVNIYPAEE